MRDYDELVKRLKESDDNCHAECYECPGECLSSGCNIFSEAADAIEELVARKTAFWVDTQPHMADSDYRKDGMSYYCSACGHRAGKYKHRTYKFCPWCGAKIVEKGEKDDKQYQLHG